MIDKQIIIDGVPVQDCCYFDYENDGYEDSCYIHQNECSAQNCYYKQLKRKEQECNKLKQTLADIKEIAEIDKGFCDKCDGDIETDCADCHEGGRVLLAKEILQKIRKCEEENKYNTKDIRHINEKNQEYIAKGNRMIKNN